ncbi:hypothetical protein Tco_0879286 [Tanacetum coccineum]
MVTYTSIKSSHVYSGAIDNDYHRLRMSLEVIEEMITRCVAEALAEQEAIRRGNGGNGNGGRNGNNGNNNNGNGDQGDNTEGAKIVAREYTYKEFLNCQPFNFKGTKGAVGLARWFKKVESVFHISNCPPKYQVKYASCTLQNNALTWWNAHKRTTGTKAAYA